MEEKTRIRLAEPARFIALTMILDGASKLAKAKQAEVSKADLIAAARFQISLTQKAIEDIRSKSNTIPIDGFKTAIEIYEDFIGPQYPEAKIRGDIDVLLNALPKEERVRKNMKRILTSAMLTWEAVGEGDMVDSKIVNRVLASMLK